MAKRGRPLGSKNKRKNNRDYKAIAEKRRAALVAKYGSWEAYQEHWSAKRTETLKAKLGEEGYKQYLLKAASKGGNARSQQYQTAA